MELVVYIRLMVRSISDVSCQSFLCLFQLRLHVFLGIFIWGWCRFLTNPEQLWLSAIMGVNLFFEGGRGFCLVPGPGGIRSASQRETMQMWEGGNRELSSTICTWCAHTQSCAEHMTHRIRAGQGILAMVLDGIQKGTRRSRYIDRKPRLKQLRGGGRGTEICRVKVNGIRQHAKRTKSEVQPPLQKYESLYL